MFYQKRLTRRLAFLLSAVALLLPGTNLNSLRAQESPTSRPRRSDDATTTQQPTQTTPAPKPTPPATRTGAPTRRDNDDITLQEDADVERVETNLTNVFFTAADKNRRFVDTLKKEDIRVLEDGVAQPIFSFQQQVDLPLTLAIVVDTSNSQENTLPDEKNAARAFVDAVIRPQKDEVAVLSFTGEATLEQGLTGSVSRVRSAIDRIEFVPPSGYVGGGVVVGTPPISGDNQTLAGSTALWDAVWVTADEVLTDAPSNTRRAIIVVTDGDDTTSKMKMSDAIDRAIKSEAAIYAIGIGDSYSFRGVDEGALRKLAERTGGRAYFPRSEQDLHAAFAQIQRDLREQYLVAYAPTNKKKDGSYRQIRIEVLNPDLRKENVKLTYRQGYFAKSLSTAAAPTPKRQP